ncbi:transcriptional regulator, IclR family protein [Halogeometricum borinquense DSM 11551]|uniref:Transcriptional regulator, IclR family n=2 Tax=Halogeometricum borinquense TaxID=60847 RepID=E4NU71_HALBP|nr:IclR family transcriptional regulator [Halogeometricum borinquense]ADQ68591.1 transcriptional regulator, IclR family [Halogeometricum borinquense DSM 11551]ELY25538.1 transcriptional regulator, IclR family protein [Halogeometricum borinquense DSM 11551]RYJ08575.1 IclR family transcriptional regulator [Halogeometricum borinquense]
MKNAKTDSVRATETSLAVLSGIETLGGGATLAELTDELEFAKSTIYKHLNTLEKGGLVVMRDNEYLIGLRCLELGGIAQRYDGIYEVAKPEVRRMAVETGELANLMIEEHGYGIYIHTTSGDQAVNLDTSLGKRVHLHQTAIGKALLSSFSDERVEEILDRHGLPGETDNTITDREALFEELETIRAEGIAYDKEERVNGTGCVGVPVETGDRREAAISITAPINRMAAPERESEIIDTVKQAANVIEVNLAHK